MSEDHKAERPVEQLLRAALAARAEQVTPQHLRPMPPLRRRPRHLRPVVLVVAPLLALAASLTAYLSADSARPAAEHDTGPVAGVTASPSPSASEAAPTPAPDVGAAADASTEDSADAVEPGSGAPPLGSHRVFKDVGFTLPTGWSVPDQSPVNSLCVLSPGGSGKPVGDCLPYGVRLVVLGAGGQGAVDWPNEQALESAAGWQQLPACPVWGNPHPMPAAARAKQQQAPQRSVVKLGSRYAEQVGWHVDCGDGSAVDLKVWGFPGEMVYLVAAGMKADYQDDLAALAQSLDVSARSGGIAGARDVKVTTDLPAALDTKGGTAPQTFTVTYTNYSPTDYRAVRPELLVAAGTAQGAVTAERLDGSTWTRLPADSSHGDPASAAAAFALAPGASRTVTFRLAFAVPAGQHPAVVVTPRAGVADPRAPNGVRYVGERITDLTAS
ncbi:hypothetical protein AB0K51_23755 [Kitasatospora sp. NPDC049285]|uniref:hypothetical protein n=1 Tax=Kitasatospora sp. NPDC049285 TaxID=3157096 RepID=UPI003440746A